MAQLDGSNTNMGYANADNADVYGTALDLTTQEGGDTKICAKLTENFSAEEEEDDVVGCGAVAGLPSQVRLSNRQYRVSLSHDMGFQNGIDRILAQFFGLTAAPVAAGTGWKHVFTLNPVRNAFHGCFAYESSSTTVIELPSTYTEKIGISMDAVEKVLKWSADLIGNTAVFSAPTNSNADLQGLAFSDTEKIVSACGTQNWLDAFLDDGTDIAMTSGEKFNITSYNFEMDDGTEVIPEVTGGSCNGPASKGDILGTLTLGVKGNSDNSWYTAWQSGAYFSSHFKVTGSAMGGGTKALEVLLPKLVLVDAPGYDVQNKGKNPFNLVFKILAAETVRPGFAGKTPQVNITNERAARYYTP